MAQRESRSTAPVASEERSIETPSSTTTTTTTPTPTPTTPPRDVSSSPNRKENNLHEAKLRKAETAVTLPHNRMIIVMPCLSLTVFLVALDSTIVATAAPSICRELTCVGADYSWLASAYLLGSAALMPLYGRLTDIVGRKPVLYSGILIFLLFSGLCGGAKDIKWMIGCRGAQGVGGGLIMSTVQIVIGDIATLQERGKYSAYIGMCWGIASLLGPLFGGLIVSGGKSFGWIFWLNLPTGGIAMVLLFFFLNLNPVQPKPLSWHLKTFDFPGLFLLTSGVICLLLGFSEAQTIGWAAATTIALVTIGGVFIVGAVIWDFHTTRQPIIPPRMFKNRTAAALLLGCLFHGIAFFALSYYQIIYFQGTKGDSALLSAVEMLPLSMVSAFVSAFAGYIITKTGRWKWILSGSWFLFTLGLGLLIALKATSPKVEACMFLLIAGIGIGALFQGPLVGLMATMPVSDMATCTGFFVLCRTLGTTLGASIGSLVFTIETTKHLAKIPGFVMPSSITADLQGLVHIADPIIRAQVVEAYASGVRSIWIVCTPLVFVAFLASLQVKEYSLRTNQSRGKKGQPTDPESGTSTEDPVELGEQGELAGTEKEIGFEDKAEDGVLSTGTRKEEPV